MTMTLCAYPLGHGLRCQGHRSHRRDSLRKGCVLRGYVPSGTASGQAVMDTVLLRSPEPSDDDITTFTSKGIFSWRLRGTPEAKAGSVGSPRWWPAELGRAMQLRIARLFTGDTAGVSHRHFDRRPQRPFRPGRFRSFGGGTQSHFGGLRHALHVFASDDPGCYGKTPPPAGGRMGDPVIGILRAAHWRQPLCGAGVCDGSVLPDSTPIWPGQ